MRSIYQNRVSDAETKEETREETSQETPQSKEKKRKEKNILTARNHDAMFSHRGCAVSGRS
jgi:hypothetical protein